MEFKNKKQELMAYVIGGIVVIIILSVIVKAFL